ncbi:PKD domain-containing protein [Acidipropionibacterium virtanenii]|uniref:Protease 1 n=1 Tax=Acidipropionibacterium virtanenii TaxID=2057246 RepID=A0A344UWM0_9ACTN|nr:PKD domain-containing protein [Acidipropionibacterium virtanenii]AXE39668.1 Protease 1 [Acidipropionibacterium virtanenii]
MRSPARHIRRILASTTAAAVGLAIGILGSTAPAAQADTATYPSPVPVRARSTDHVTADPLPTVQINDGYVWAQTTIGTTVYAVGQFKNVRPAGAAVGTNLTARSNILAYDITTGDLITAFAPTVNGVIKAVAPSPDGKRVYIGGSFTSVNGQARSNFAVLDAATGQLVSGLAPSVGGTGVYAITATADAVYVGGLFTQANGVARRNLSAFDTSTGALRSWAPTTDLQVDAMVMEPKTGQVVIGGRFYAVNSKVQRGLANLNPTTGAVNTAWQAPSTVKNGWNSGTYAGGAGIFALTTDANGVYGTGWVHSNASVGNLEGTFAAEAGTGKVRWVADCHGDHYGVYSTGSVVYTTNHTHQCETVSMWGYTPTKYYRYAESYTAQAKGKLTTSSVLGSIYKDWGGTPSPAAHDWFPDFTVGTTSGLGQAGLTVTGANGYVSIGGEFGTVNNHLVQGLTRFSTKPSTGAKQGPRVQTADWKPTATGGNAGTARITVPANWDRDDLDLTYALYRQGTTAPVATKVASSTWWNLPSVSLTDPTAAAGSSHTYTVRATDRDGNSVTSSPVTVSVASGTTSKYATEVLKDDPSVYYRLGGSTTDWAGSNNPFYGGGVTTTRPGGPAEQGSAGSTFNGNTNGRVSTSRTTPATAPISQETWFRTTGTRGGALLGYGSAQAGASTNHDRQVYMTNNGRIVYGVYPGAVKTVTSPRSYNDGSWHHVVTTLGSEGMRLYMDGALVASNASVTSAQSYSGYWRIGGDSLSGSWPNKPTGSYFVGSMSDAAFYPKALTARQISQHYQLGKGLTPPSAAFTTTKNNLTASVDASTSTAPSGRTISSYSWDWGDGSNVGSGRTAAHTYDEDGTYQVSLTITDSSGMTSTSTKPVVVQSQNVLPTASFTSTVNGLTASVDGTASGDTDGSIAGYSWNWGDGTAAGTGRTSAHTYAKAGTYTITLTTTDDRGGTATKTGTVTVTHGAPTAAFNMVANGLGISVDAGDSTADDAAALSYAWDWGDGTAAGSGKNATHTYAKAGSYTVKLTVTDSLDRTATASQRATVSQATYIASDDFSRDVASGWGAAAIGGTWSAMYGTASVASVDGSTGKIALPVGQTRNMALPSASALDSDSSVRFSLSAAPSQGNSYVGIASRQSSSTAYQVRAWMRSDGSVWLVAEQSGETLKAQQVSGLTWTAGEKLNLRTKVTGTSPTTIEARIWKQGSTEPTTWQLSTTDSTAALQKAGYTSLHFARATTATAASTASFDDFRVSSATTSAPDPEPEPVNQAPRASFTASSDSLTASVNASASTDDTSISSYAWDWGDGTSAGSGRTATHTYAKAGTYTVKLTVSDGDGLTGTATKSVTVTAPATDPGTDTDPETDTGLASDKFARTTASGWGTADKGGAWSTMYGSSSAASITNGYGQIRLDKGQMRAQMLNGVSTRDVSLRTTFSATEAPTTGQAYVGLTARQTAAGDNYQARVWLRPDGTVWLVTQHGGDNLSTYAVPGLTWKAGDSFTLKAQVTGSATTTIRAKIWKADGTEPASWQVTSTDSTAALQAAGAVGVTASRGSTATTTGVFRFTDFSATEVD